jgi:hypothetical protein
MNVAQNVLKTTLPRFGLGSGSNRFGVMRYMMDAYYVVQHMM